SPPAGGSFDATSGARVWRSANIADAAAFGGRNSPRGRGRRVLPDAMMVVRLAVVRGYSRREREIATDKATDVVSLMAAGRSLVFSGKSRGRYESSIGGVEFHRGPLGGGRGGGVWPRGIARILIFACYCPHRTSGP